MSKGKQKEESSSSVAMIPTPEVMAERTESELLETSQFLSECDLNTSGETPDTYTSTTLQHDDTYLTPYDNRRRLSEQELLLEEPIFNSHDDDNSSTTSSFAIPPPPMYPPPCPARRTRSQTAGIHNHSTPSSNNQEHVQVTVTPHDSTVSSVASSSHHVAPPGSYTDVDVILGRGGKSNNHPGNQLYLQDKDSLQPRYFVVSKREKTQIAQELVDRVHARGGRFMKQGDDGQWDEVLNDHARRKASQSLRELSSKESRAEKREKYKNRSYKRK